MAVRSSTVSERGGTGPSGPVRTCVGCRTRAVAADLLRVVVTSDASGKVDCGPGARVVRGPETLSVVPDPRHRAPGRGAWLHRDPECVELAERRRAVARALRVPGARDLTAVREYVGEVARQSTGN